VVEGIEKTRAWALGIRVGVALRKVGEAVDQSINFSFSFMEGVARRVGVLAGLLTTEVGEDDQWPGQYFEWVQHGETGVFRRRDECIQYHEKQISAIYLYVKYV